MNKTLVGNTARLVASFFDHDDNPVTLTAVTCTLKRPDGTISNPAVTLSGNTATASFVGAMTGPHWARFESSGALVAAAEAEVVITASKVL